MGPAELIEFGFTLSCNLLVSSIEVDVAGDETDEDVDEAGYSFSFC